MSMGSNPVFPIMTKQYYFSYLSSILNINKSHKILSFKIIFNKNNFKTIKLLKKLNFIHKFTVVEYNKLIYLNVYLYFYKNINVGTSIKVISKPSKFFFISYKSLRLLNKRTGSSFLILSTPNGLLSHNEALKLRSTGLVLGFFSL